MQKKKSDASNEPSSLDQRLDLMFNELKAQKELFNELNKQNLFLIKKENVLEQYICQLLHLKNENSNIHNEEKNDHKSKVKKNQQNRNENLPKRNHNEKLPPLNKSQNVKEKMDSSIDISQANEDPKSNYSKLPKVSLPNINNTSARKVTNDIKQNKQKEEMLIQESESEPESVDNEVEKVHFISITKEKAKRNPETWQKYINKKVESKPFKIVYLGEAYVYESLNRMNCFEKIYWNANTANENNPYVVLNNGNKYFIDENGDHYDIIAEDSEHKKYYFEVKSTEKTSRSKKIKQKQRKLYASLNPKNNFCIIAIVKTVFESPTIQYCLYDPIQDKCDKTISSEDAEIDFMRYISEKKNLQ